VPVSDIGRVETCRPLEGCGVVDLWRPAEWRLVRVRSGTSEPLELPRTASGVSVWSAERGARSVIGSMVNSYVYGSKGRHKDVTTVQVHVDGLPALLRCGVV